MSESAVLKVSPQQAFKSLNDALLSSRDVVPLFGSGVSVEAGIPTSTFLADYLVGVAEFVRDQGWQDYADFLRTRGWPSRHDVWAHWLSKRQRWDFNSLSKAFDDLRNDFYRSSLVHEMRSMAPLYARMLSEQLKLTSVGATGFTDYRSLLSHITRNDDTLSDSFFDHFVRGRQPSTTHQFIAFVTQLFGIRTILTTNFDNLIEAALRIEGLNPTVYEVARDGTVPSALLVRAQQLSLVKLHGGTHALRTGYDLDDRLPIAALEEVRKYLRPDRRRDPTERQPPLLLVMGYSGSDRRVMDAVADHLSQWDDQPRGRPATAEPQPSTVPPLVLWVSRGGDVPPSLEAAARSAIYSAETSGRATSLARPVQLCTYQNARLFLQELYQVVTHQHAVTRSSYRAVVSVPKRAVVGYRDPASDEPAVISRFQVFHADREGYGTSAALVHNAYAKFGRTHEVIWVDASEFSTRARLVNQIIDEFLLVDRGLNPITRPLLISDVDFIRCEHAAKGKPAGPKPADMPARSDPPDDDGWELEVAVRWITTAMSRGNYVLAIDSLGEFSSIHPAAAELYPEPGQLEVQKRLLRVLLSRLRERSPSFGRSILMAAYTPMSPRRAALNPSTPRHVDAVIELKEITGGYTGYTRDVAHDARKGTSDSDPPSRSDDSVDAVRALLSNNASKAAVAVGVMIVLASFYRRPRSRVALQVTFIRFARLLAKEVDDSLRGYHSRMLDDGKTVDDDKYMNDIATAALQGAEEERCKGEMKWTLLSRLEGGCYWMHLGARDAIYKASMGDDVAPAAERAATAPTLPLKMGRRLVSDIFDSIAKFAIDDVFERSQDIAAFNEYVYYRFVSIAVRAGLKPASQARSHSSDLPQVASSADQSAIKQCVEWLEWLINAVEREHESLLASGRLVALISQLRPVVKMLILLDDALPNGLDTDARKLNDLSRVLFGRYSALLLASGHYRDALAYKYLQVRLFSTSTQRRSLRELVNELRSIDPKATVPKLTSGALALIKQPSTMNESSDPLWIAMDVARLLAEPIYIFGGVLLNGLVARGNSRSLAPWLDERKEFKAERRTPAEGILTSLHSRLRKQSPNVAGNATSIRNLAAMVATRRLHLKLLRALSGVRYEWLENGAGNSSPVNRRELKILGAIVTGCHTQLEIVRGGQSNPLTQRIENYLHTVRAVAQWYLGSEAAANVSFRRAHAVLRRPPAPGELSASAISFLAEAECRLHKARRDRDKLVKRASYASTSGPRRGGHTPESQQSHGEEVRRHLSAARTLLEQARPLLSAGRIENRWRATYYYLEGVAWYTLYEVTSMPEESNENMLARRQYIRSALRHTVAGLTTTGKFSDRRIILKALFYKIDIEGSTIFLDQAWTTVREECGIPPASSMGRADAEDGIPHGQFEGEFSDRAL